MCHPTSAQGNDGATVPSRRPAQNRRVVDGNGARDPARRGFFRPARDIFPSVASPERATMNVGRQSRSGPLLGSLPGGRTAVRSFTIRYSRTIAVVQASALAVVLSATCLVDAGMTPAQKACCEAMGHDCNHMAQPQRCCPVETPRIAQASVLARFYPLPPAAPVSLLPQLVSGSCVRSLPRSTSAGFSPLSRGVPTYVLVSAFRI